jgi:hypothetical protein
MSGVLKLNATRAPACWRPSASFALTLNRCTTGPAGRRADEEERAMPTNRRRRTRTHCGGAGVSDECLRFYRWVGLIPFADFPWARGKTDAEINKFYQDNREEIQRRYKEKYGSRLKR